MFFCNWSKGMFSWFCESVLLQHIFYIHFVYFCCCLIGGCISLHCGYITAHSMDVHLSESLLYVYMCIRLCYCVYLYVGSCHHGPRVSFLPLLCSRHIICFSISWTKTFHTDFIFFRPSDTAKPSFNTVLLW